MQQNNLLNFPRRFLCFLHERFSPISHFPMILAFTLANTGIVGKMLSVDSNQILALLSFLVVTFFFLRLRLFDELKDLSLDIRIHPERPLARKLISVRETYAMILLLFLIEISMIWFISPNALSIYLLAAGFSLIMFKEFFIGRIIRPLLTTYAVMHTFVAILMGYMVAAVAFNLTLRDLSSEFLLFGLVNWSLFNLFEFSRKTCVAQEENPEIETYSAKFSPPGAVALCMAQIGILIAITACLVPEVLPREALTAQLALVSLPLGASLYYLYSSTTRSSSVYRLSYGVYLIIAYLAFWMTTL